MIDPAAIHRHWREAVGDNLSHDHERAAMLEWRDTKPQRALHPWWRGASSPCLSCQYWKPAVQPDHSKEAARWAVKRVYR